MKVNRSLRAMVIAGTAALAAVSLWAAVAVALAATSAPYFSALRMSGKVSRGGR
jgi:hypothetical protein